MFITINEYSTTLAADFSSYDTVMVVTSDAGLPALIGGRKLALRLTDAGTQTAIEIVYVTLIAGTSLTVERAQEGTSALDWSQNDVVFAPLTAETTQLIKPVLNSLNVGGGDDIVLDDSEAYADILEFTGALTDDISVTVPSTAASWQIYNNTTGAHVLTLTVSGGNSIAIAQGGCPTIICDGTNLHSDIVSSSSIPIGGLMPFAGSASPADNFLLCYGQAISRATYAPLFAAIGTSWGAGDGTTTFNVPDLRGRAVFGKDDMGGAPANRVTNGGSGINGTTLGAVGGDELMQQHQHSLSALQALFGSLGGGGSAGGPATATGNVTGVSTGNSGNMPPAAIVNWLIRAY